MSDISNAEKEELGIPLRANVDVIDGVVFVCGGHHEKYEPCEYVRWDNQLMDGIKRI